MWSQKSFTVQVPDVCVIVCVCVSECVWLKDWNDIKHFHLEGMEQHNLKNVNSSLNTNIYSYLETSGGQSSNLYLNVVHFFNARVE